MEERKFVCKYCSKRFPCGKSLGGHIRTHMTEHSVQDNEERSNADTFKFDAGKKRKRDLGSEAGAGAGFGAGGNPIYGLRENPKKTTRFVHSNATLQRETFCKECGKGFSSLKALCGHMACHSEKEKGTNKFETNSGFIEKQKLVMDSQSDTETSAPIHRRRSKRMRFKTLSNHPSSSSVPLANGSSPGSEVEQEQEEVARCLMLLSKDSSHRGRFPLVTESSDNNSVVLEAKSTSADTKITINNGKNSASEARELVGKKLLRKDMKLKSAEIVVLDKADSGYFRYGSKKVESDVSNDGFFRNDESKKLKVGDRSGFEEHDVEARKMMNRGRSRNSEFKKLVLENLDHGRTDEATRKFDSRKRGNYDSLGQNLVGVSSKKTGNGFTNDESYEHGGKKGLKYEFLTSERDNGSYDSTYESDENSTDTDSYPAPKAPGSKVLNGKKSSKVKKKLKSKKSREHECPICYKIFRSGQALGGHKRSHFVGGSEQNTLVIRHGAPPAAVPCLIDLNLPAPFDE